MIQLPLNNDLLKVENKKFKRKFNLGDRRLSSALRMAKKIDNNNNNSVDSNKENEQDENEIMTILKKNSEEIFKIGFGIFLGAIQNILKVGKNDTEHPAPHLELDRE